jgi:mitosis inhibitor protein kinase SWE1
LKPANVLITFEGSLKIADFGMATKWPAKSGIEGEGDREYIGPEILMGKFDKPADVFALGLIVLETAGNVELPDNGVSWQKLRNGDMSDVPSLTWSSQASSILRDASGNPISKPDMTEVEPDVMDSDIEQSPRSEQKSRSLLARNGELTTPPDFMINASNQSALDQVVRWMISPEPAHRPRASDLLTIEGLRFAYDRRRAGATIYEGNWGPADSVLAEDAEMLDV